MASKTAVAFEKIIQTDRARKKNEALAAKIFKKDRRASAPVAANGFAASGKPSTRAGVKKRVVSTSAGNVHSEWAHDLHEPRAGPKKIGKSTAAGAGAPGSLANRISRPGAAPAARAAVPATARGRQQQQLQQQRRAAKAAAVLTHAERAGRPSAAAAAGGGAGASGLSIRGLAASPDEPITVMAQNFAPGTTAADIESAMTPVGGLISSCRILKTSPLVIAEIVFENGEGGRRVIETFNNQTADGRLLHVYAKVIGVNTGGGGGSGGDGYASGKNSSNSSSVLTPHHGNGARLTTTAGGGAADATAQKAHNSDSAYVVDGSLGFDDPMDTDGLHSNGHLYSDDLVGAPRAPRAAPTGPAAGARAGAPTGPSGYGGYSGGGGGGGGGGRRGGGGGGGGGGWGGGRGGGRGGWGGYGSRR